MKKARDESSPLIGTKSPFYIASAPPIDPRFPSREEVVPVEVIIPSSSSSVLPDRVIQDTVKSLVVMGNRDGDNIVYNDSVAKVASTSVGQSLQRSIEAKVKASNQRDSIADLSVKTFSTATALTADDIEVDTKPNTGAGDFSGGRRGYAIADYQSLYDSPEGCSYQPQEYKSIYD
eukprot:gene2841-3101_t